MASRLMPRLIAWVASECLSWCGVTWPIPAALAARRTAASTRVLGDGPAVLGEHERAWLAAPVIEPLVKQGFHARVQRNVAVAVELADRDVQPVPVADPHDRIGAEAEELALAHPFSRRPQTVA